jgi:hypothetical protein
MHMYSDKKIRIDPYFVMINISNRLRLKLGVLQVSVKFMGRKFFVEVRR